MVEPGKICTQCNAQVDVEESYCQECGAKMEGLITCERCGKEFDGSFPNCPWCTAKVVVRFPDITCPNARCGNVWTPRKANPKACPACGYRLSKAHRTHVAQAQDMGSVGMNEGTCSQCEKETRFYMNFKRGGESMHQEWCYDCVRKFMDEQEKDGEWKVRQSDDIDEV